MDNNLNYTVSTGGLWLPFAAIEELWQSLDAAQQRLCRVESAQSLAAMEFPDTSPERQSGKSIASGRQQQPAITAKGNDGYSNLLPDAAAAPAHSLIIEEKTAGNRAAEIPGGLTEGHPTFVSDLHAAPHAINDHSLSAAAEHFLLPEQQDRMATSGGAGTVNNFNVSFEHLIGTVNNTFDSPQSMRDSDDFMQQLTGALQTILNDTNYTI
jgi:hypothetical protein